MQSLKKIYHLIRRFIISFLLLLFIDFIFIIVVTSVQFKHQSSESLTSQVASEITFSSERQTLTQKGKEIVKNNHLWLIIIDSNTGNVTFQYKKPHSIPTSYNLADGIKFSRYYLKNYPVFTNITENNIAVIGFPKNSVIRIPSNYFERDDFRVYLILGIGLLTFNFLYFIILYTISTNFIKSRLSPLITAIENLPNGLEKKVPNQDELEKITQAINSADKKLKETESFKEEWISGIAHDIKTPLSVIISNTDLAKKDADYSKLNKRLNSIMVEAYYIQNVLNDLNIYERLVNGNFELKTTATYIVPFFRKIIIQILNQKLGENFDFQFEADSSLNNKTFMIEENLMSRVVHNIIYNTILHNPNGCKIEINLYKDGNNVKISFKDNGVGISNERLKDLKHFKAETTFNISGAYRHGIGLKISKQIVELHDGYINFESEENRFFKADITLPIRKNASLD